MNQPSAPAESSPTPRGTVRYEVADAVGTITFDRPEQMNALDTPTKVALLEAVTAAAEDEAVRCLLLTGTGRAFCVGQDLREHVRLLTSADESLWHTVPEHYNPIARALATMPKPVVAGLNGVAAGAGASLAMAADLRIVAESAGFNLAFAGIALSADTGASWYLPRLIGLGRARDLLLRPRTVGSAEALSLGLASEVVPDADLADRARAVAAELAAGPTVAYAALREVTRFSLTHDLDESLDLEGEWMARTGATADHAEAVEAFLAKRAPRFSGR